MKKSLSKRVASLWMIAGIYSLAVAFGVLTYLLVDWDNEIGKMLLADVAATLVVWLFGIVLDNSSVYDPYWSLIPPLMIAGWILSLKPERWEGIVALGLVVLFWSIRLTRNWFGGWTDFDHQDWRYTMIRNSHPKLWFLANLFGINLMPTLIVFLQLAGVPAFIRKEPGLNGWIVSGLLICLGAVIIQATADHQMESFRKRNQGRKLCIDEGLWRYSRHPNYFGEVAMWWGVWLILSGGIGMTMVSLIPPVMMTCLFLFISIPMMEKKILSTRPEYGKSIETISMLIPFFRRRPKTEEDSVITRD